MQLVCVGVPVNFPGAGKVYADGLGPAIEAWEGGFAGVICVSRSERLKNAKSMPVADGPGNKWQDGEHCADGRHAQHQPGTPKLCSIKDKGGTESDREECSVGAKQRGITEGKGEQEKPSPLRIFEQPHKAEQRQGNTEQLKGLSEWSGGVVCRKGAECSHPEGGPSGTTRSHFRSGPCNQQTTGEVNRNLGIHDGVVMLHSKETEAEHQEEWISGQADQCWTNALCPRQAVDAMLHPVFGDVAVNQRVSLDFGIGMNEPEPENGPGAKREESYPPPARKHNEHANESYRVGRNFRAVDLIFSAPPESAEPRGSCWCEGRSRMEGFARKMRLSGPSRWRGPAPEAVYKKLQLSTWNQQWRAHIQ